MDENYGRLIEKILPDILNNAKGLRMANKLAKVAGSRHMLPLEGREVEIVYYPAKSSKAPLFIGLHGGGFLFGGSALDDELWVSVSEYLDVNIASVDYRMSPDVKDFDCLYDCYDAAVYLQEHAAEFGFDKDHISVFGASAGGNLAAALAILDKERGGKLNLDQQILMYPFLDGHTDPDSKGDGSFSGVMPHIMNQLHFSQELSDHPLLSPYYADTQMLKGLPRAFVVYCEKDNLRREAVEYCAKLREAGVEVFEFFAANMPHAYIENGFKSAFTPVEKEMLGPDADELISSGQLHQVSMDTLEFLRRDMIR